jgi:hypothetical protein
LWNPDTDDDVDAEEDPKAGKRKKKSGAGGGHAKASKRFKVVHDDQNPSENAEMLKQRLLVASGGQEVDMLFPSSEAGPSGSPS